MSEVSQPAAERVPDVRRFRVTAFAVGLLAGIGSALLGIGGGLIMVPAMALLLHIRQHRAVGTSLAVIIPTALVAAYRYHTEALENGQPGLQLGVVLWLAVGGVVGGVIGALLASALHAKQLRRLFGVFVVLTGIVMITQIKASSTVPMTTSLDMARSLQMVGIGTLVGTLSGLLGVGGGLVMVPALVLLLGYPQHLAQATSLAVIVPVSISGTLVHMRKGNVLWGFAFWLSIGAMLAAYITATWVFQIPKNALQILFGVFMIGMGLTMVRSRPQKKEDAESK